jgi:hypothetical protein
MGPCRVAIPARTQEGRVVRRTGRQRPSTRNGRTTVSITCQTDGRAHDVPDEQLAEAQGRYLALCGHRVTVGSLAEPAGAPCPDCAAL